MSRDEIVHDVTLSLTDGYAFTASFDRIPGGSPVELDEPEPLGHGQAPNATDLLAAAVGNCLAASLLFCLRRSRAGVEGMSAHVRVRVGRNDAGRHRIQGIEVELVPELAEADAGRLKRCDDLFEDFCIVTQSVRAGIPVEVSVREAETTAAE